MATLTATIDTSYSSIFQTSSTHPYSGSCCGHAYKVISDGVSDVASGVFSGTKKMVHTLGHLRLDANAFSKMLKLSTYAFTAVEAAMGRPGMFAIASKRILMTDGIMDSFQCLDQIGYFGMGKHKGDSIYNILGNVSFGVVGVGGIALLLEEVTLINLSKIGEAIGSIPVFGMATQLGVGLGTIVSSAVGIAFAFWGANAIRDIVQSDDPQENTKAWLMLTWCVSEVALKVFVVAGGTNPVGLIALGTIAAVLGITTFLYGISIKESCSGHNHFALKSCDEGKK